MDKKKYKIVNGKKVRDHSGFGKLGKFLKNSLKVVTRTDGFKTYSKNKLKNIRETKQDSTKGLPNLNKINPLNKQNKRIREKEKGRTKDNSRKTDAQISALKRKRDGKTIASVNADNKKAMQDRARKRNEAFKKTGKSTIEQRRAAAKKAMQDRARAKNDAFKKKRAKK